VDWQIDRCAVRRAGHHGPVQPADLNDESNWAGGFYELALELGAEGDDAVAQALLAVWREACVLGCFGPEYVAAEGPTGGSARRRLVGHTPVEPGARALERYGHVHGVVEMAGGAAVVCGASALREVDGHDWLTFYLPLGALSALDDRVRGYPFGPDGGPGSLAWRAAVDDWLAGIAIAVFPELRFRLGLIGCEAVGEVNAASVAVMPRPAYLGYLLPVDGGMKYLRATA
jgi:hypothetical protein